MLKAKELLSVFVVFLVVTYLTACSSTFEEPRSREPENARYRCGFRPSGPEIQDVSELLQIIDQSPQLSATRFNPALLIRAVNRLHPKGKVEAIRVLRMYVYLRALDPAGSEPWGPDCDRVIPICRLLFQKRERSPAPPQPSGIGSTVGDLVALASFPQAPLTLVGDVPFLVIGGISAFGAPTFPMEHIEYADVHCDIIAKPLIPALSPTAAANQLTSSQYWQRLHGGPDSLQYAAELIRFQASLALKCLTLAASDRRRLLSGDRKTSEQCWRAIVHEVLTSAIYWDADSQEFCRRN